MVLARNIQSPRLDLRVDGLRGRQHSLLHVTILLRARLHKKKPVLLRKRLPLLARHLAPMLQVRLVPHEDDRHVRVRVRLRILQPRQNVLERLLSRNVVHEQGARSPAIVAARDAAEGLLPGRVPYLQLDVRAVDRHDARAELDADRQVVDRREFSAGELAVGARAREAGGG